MRVGSWYKTLEEKKGIKAVWEDAKIRLVFQRIDQQLSKASNKEIATLVYGLLSSLSPERLALVAKEAKVLNLEQEEAREILIETIKTLINKPRGRGE